MNNKFYFKRETDAVNGVIKINIEMPLSDNAVLIDEELNYEFYNLKAKKFLALFICTMFSGMLKGIGLNEMSFNVLQAGKVIIKSIDKQDEILWS